MHGYQLSVAIGSSSNRLKGLWGNTLQLVTLINQLMVMLGHKQLMRRLISLNKWQWTE